MKQTKTTIITLSILIGILLLGALVIILLNNRQAQLELKTSEAANVLRSDTAQTAYTDFDGNTANLEQYLGQVIVVTSWASWSPFSGSELSLLADASAQYAKEDVVLIAINRGEPKSTAKAYLKTIGVDDRVTLVVDEADSYYTKIGGYTMPETLVYDRQGGIVAHVRGRLTSGEVTSYIEEALARE